MTKTQEDPTPPADNLCHPDGSACDTVLGVGIPDICGPGGYTLLAFTPCGAENPTHAEACQNIEWRTQLDCSQYPLQPVPIQQLPSTGAQTLPIAGTGLFALIAGVLLLRFSSRRAVAHRVLR